MAWLLAHWKDLVLVVLAIDSALIPLLPQVPLLVKIRDILSKVPAKSE